MSAGGAISKKITEYSAGQAVPKSEPHRYVYIQYNMKVSKKAKDPVRTSTFAFIRD